MSVRTLTGALLLAILGTATGPACAEDFPFGQELTLDARAMPGSKRLPILTIGAHGEVEAGLWCRTLRGQFSVAGNTLIFIPGPGDQPQCSPEQTSRDEALAADLAAATTWSMQGEVLILQGAGTLKYRLNTN